jgi:1,4-dihydroxy-2-naphthoate octaprenyltransferase
MKSENLISPPFQGVLKSWIVSLRFPTLIAGISPVAIGSMIATAYHPLSMGVLFGCLFFSLCLQIATNWANDYFDFIKGADTSERKGPHRALQLQSISPEIMRNAAIAAFVLSMIISVPLILRIGLIYTPLMLLCIGCAIAYSGGKRALGYRGWGDLLVFIFYGPIATCFSSLAQLHFIPLESLIASILPGAFSCAILCINNLRDIAEDRRSKKLTLIVRFGNRFGQMQYMFCVSIALFTPLMMICNGQTPLYLIVWMALLFVKKPLRIVMGQPAQLNQALNLTAKLFTVATILFCLAMYAHIYL